MKFLKTKWPYFLVLVLFLCGLVLNFNFQDQIKNGDGKGFDGVHYYKIAEQIKSNQQIDTEAPFVYRVGTPFLVSVLPFSLIDNFKTVNYLSTLLNCLLLIYWFSFFFKKKATAFVLTVLIMCHWEFGLRFVAYYPTTSDPLTITFILALLILIRKYRKSTTTLNGLLFTSTLFLSVFFREFLIIFSFGLLTIGPIFNSKKLTFIDLPILITNVKWFLIAFLSGAIGIYCTHSMVHTETSDYGFLMAVFEWMNKKTIFTLTTGMFNTFGVAIIFVFIFWKDTFNFFKQHNEYTSIAILGLFICWFSGGDTERFFLWFSPIFLLPLGIITEKQLPFVQHKLIWLVVAITSIFSMRIFWPIPQAYIGSQNTNLPILQAFQKDFVDLCSQFGDRFTTTIVLIQYILISLLLFFMIRYESFTKHSKSERTNHVKKTQ